MAMLLEIEGRLTAPFATIERPREGETVSAGYWSFGWALDDSGVARVTVAAESAPPTECAIGQAFPGVADVYPRYPDAERHVPVLPDQLLSARRQVDVGNSLWLTYNVIQENLVAGGLHGRSASGRASRTRAIRAIREDVRINVGLWNHAMTLLDR